MHQLQRLLVTMAMPIENMCTLKIVCVFYFSIRFMFSSKKENWNAIVLWKKLFEKINSNGLVEEPS